MKPQHTASELEIFANWELGKKKVEGVLTLLGGLAIIALSIVIHLMFHDDAVSIGMVIVGVTVTLGGAVKLSNAIIEAQRTY